MSDFSDENCKEVRIIKKIPNTVLINLFKINMRQRTNILVYNMQLKTREKYKNDILI
jgi:hypothetical protein